MAKRTLGIDVETYSSVDLAKAGVYAYTEAPDFDILLIGYKYDDEDEVHVIDTLAVDRDFDEELYEFRQALTDPSIVKTAFNANFERTCLAKWTGAAMPPEEWRCTMIKALTMGLPGNLADAGMALGLPEDKLKDPQGKALIRFFSKPCKPTRTNGQRTRNLPAHDPEKWKLFIAYNRQDVVTEQEILKRLAVYKIPDAEQALWSLDQHMNDNGVKLDIPMVEKIVEYDTQRRQELQEEAQEITGLSNPNSLAQLKKWLASQGVEMASVTKDTIAEALAGDLPENVRRMLEIRTALGKTSVAKYSTMLTAVCQDHRLRGILQFYGANRSGRWAGRLVQTHNLAKNSLPDLDLARELAAAGDFDTMQTLFGETAFVFSELIRTAFIPSDGCRFVVSDFSAIEARVIAWLAGEEWTLKTFRDGGDVYCATASMMYHVPVVKHGVNGHLRQKGKVAVLACIAEGQQVLTDVGPVPIEQVTTDMLLWDGVEWVNHEGVVYKGEKEVIQYGGLEATADHVVWAEVDGKNQQIRFGDAASCGARLVQSGAGRQTVRVAPDNITGTEIHEGVERVLCPDGVHRMRTEVLDAAGQHDAGQDQRMPELQPEESGPAVAGQKVHSGKTALRESERPAIQELRSSGDTLRISKRDGRLHLHDRNLRTPGQGTEIGNRQDRQQWKLCSGKPQVGDQERAEREQARKQKVRVYDILSAGPRNRFTVSGVLVHNCGYQGGVGAMKRMDKDGTIPEDELQGIVDMWRNANPHIVKLWRTCELAAKTAITEHRTVRIQHGVAFSYVNGNLFIKLPSGRKLCYWDTRLKLDPRDGRDHIVYMGVNQETKQWGETETYGGKLVENIVQATARDCLAVAMTRVSELGYKIVMHVHDEMIVDVPNEDTKAPAVINDIMSQPIDWAPGLPLKGDTYETPFYKKD